MWQTEIEVNFDQMKKLSLELSQTAEKVKQSVDVTGMEILSETKAAWCSQNADVFVGKEVKQFERIREISMNLNSLSREIYEKAKMIYEMEQRNANRRK